MRDEKEMVGELYTPVKVVAILGHLRTRNCIQNVSLPLILIIAR